MIDADLRTYLKNAGGEEPPLRHSDPRWADTELVAHRLIERSAAEAALKALDQEPPARKKRWDILLLTALLQQGLGERARSLDTLEVVADKLLAAGDRDGVLALLPRFLEPDPAPAAVRFLHFLARGPASDEERSDWLRAAIAIRPADPELHADLAALLERSPERDAREAAREHRLRAMELSLEDGVLEGLSEALFRAVDEDLDRSPARVGKIVLRYAAAVDWSDSEPILDLALPTLESRAQGRFTWDELAPILPRLPGSGARALFGRLFRVAVGNEPDPEAIVQGSGLLDPRVATDEVAARVPKILALPPGAYVTHQSWGIGRVTSSDGESLTLDLPGRAGHKMSIAMASRSLDRLPNDGLRVLTIEDAARAKTLAAQGDPEILVRALRDVGGAATQAQLKPRLEAALPEFDWAVFWRKGKERWKSDARLDTSEAYRGQFRLAPEGSEASAVTLPTVAPKAPTQGLQLIRKFLREHPEEEARLAAHAGTLVARRTRGSKASCARRRSATRSPGVPSITTSRPALSATWSRRGSVPTTSRWD
jgi:hypothetical protein